jgi:hypothetical protein
MHPKDLVRSSKHVRFRAFDVYLDERRAGIMTNEIIERRAWHLKRGARRLIRAAGLNAGIVMRGIAIRIWLR